MIYIASTMGKEGGYLLMCALCVVASSNYRVSTQCCDIFMFMSAVVAS